MKQFISIRILQCFFYQWSSVTKNFVWKLSDRIPDRTANPANGTGYFGGCLRFVNDTNRVAPMANGTKVMVPLTPTATARYLDSTNTTAAGTIVQSFTIVAGTSNYYLTDIPVTEYHMTIKSELNGVVKEVYVGGNDRNNLYQWLEFDFNPSGTAALMKAALLYQMNFLTTWGRKTKQSIL